MTSVMHPHLSFASQLRQAQQFTTGAITALTQPGNPPVLPDVVALSQASAAIAALNIALSQTGTFRFPPVAVQSARQAITELGIGNALLRTDHIAVNDKSAQSVASYRKALGSIDTALHTLYPVRPFPDMPVTQPFPNPMPPIWNPIDNPGNDPVTDLPDPSRWLELA